MTDIQAINLSDLQRHYLETNERAVVAAQTLDDQRENEGWLAIRLRDHRDREVMDKEEVTFRDGVDGLLSFYSLVELACLAQFVPPELTSPFREKALRDLGDPSVRLYYERHYPILLPMQLRLRLEGRHRLCDEMRPESPALFMQFLNVNSQLENDEEVTTFFMFLDDYQMRTEAGTFSLTDLLLIVSDSNLFFSHLAIEPAEQTPLDWGLHGFRKFLLFCYELDELLQEAALTPLLRSGVYVYYSYWFDNLREKLRFVLDRAIELFVSASQLGDSEDDRSRTVEGIARLAQIVNNLLHNSHRVVLDSAIHS